MRAANTCWAETMKRLFAFLILSMLLGCASQTKQHVSRWNPTPSEIRETFEKIPNPCKDDAFANHAFADGFITAYSLGPGSLGALIATPERYREKKLDEAFRTGWAQGGSLAFQRSPALNPLTK